VLAAGGCISGFIAVVRWPVELGAAEDAELAIDLHSETGGGLAGQLTGSLAGPKQGIRDPLRVGILALGDESCRHGRPLSLSSLGAGPPLSMLCH